MKCAARSRRDGAKGSLSLSCSRPRQGEPSETESISTFSLTYFCSAISVRSLHVSFNACITSSAVCPSPSWTARRSSSAAGVLEGVGFPRTCVEFKNRRSLIVPLISDEHVEQERDHARHAAQLHFLVHVHLSPAAQTLPFPPPPSPRTSGRRIDF
ncbi:hypothetical protein T492DRAFT_1033486 [Pavlovales sp. CCMP2436]|nr:hypothetical protein T492DRAFT_1033486 [Pavlovales sp. CCMP2436]